MYLWDSNILRAFGAGHATVRQYIDRVSWEKIALPSVVVSEVLRGRIEFTLKADTGAQLAQANRLFMETYEMLQSFNVLVFDEASGREFDNLRRQYKKHKRRADMSTPTPFGLRLIASIALAGKHIVVTRNAEHFRELLPQPQIENWIDIPPR